jgi:catechol 2,3-dioxygenase-like lactoylglutathione lyase family enzyme
LTKQKKYTKKKKTRKEESTLKAQLKLDHVVMNVHDMNAMRHFFMNVLGCQLVNQVPEGVPDPEMLFFSLHEKHHDFALVKSSQKMKARERQIHHIALEVEDRYRWCETLAELIDQGIEIVEGPLAHGFETGDEFISGDSGHVSFFIEGPEVRVEFFTQSSKRPADYKYPAPWATTLQKFFEERKLTPVN